mgnify:CR=1 FL=1
MDSGEIERKIQSILWGKAIVDIEDGGGVEHNVIIRALTSKENNIVNYLYNKEIKKCKENGLCTSDELAEIYNKNGTWTREDEEKILKLQNGIKKLKNVLPDYKYLRSKYLSIKKRIKKAEKESSELQQTRAELFYNSLENRASEVRMRKVAQFCVETLDEQTFWDEADFLYTTDLDFVHNIMVAYSNEFILPTSQMRELARSSEWRYRWKASKNGASLFDKAVAEWSEAQNSIVFWSQYYDWIFEHPDCPMGLINNDEALDKWVEAQNKKDRGKNVLSNKGSTNPNAINEQFVMVEKGDKDSIEEIQSQNDAATRRRLAAEDKRLKEKGKAKEWDLRHQLYKK